ncbi:YceI family protein [Flavobacterium sp. NRK1]|uniref:YceI family protein n=1 Tax=Flavobacterium sp. NRK1 TaxID=2954929 RepID=UPI002092A5BE|nr:YceI family protein [Flavobacterium sp. NRK1]MCO6146774.1 YceI family protein [Flavobacterium sp. NRK1]
MKTLHFLLVIAIAATGISCKRESKAAPAKITEAETPKPITPAAKKYIVDTIASSISWTGSKPTGKHMGTISLSKGEIFAKNDTVETGTFTINMKSITVTDPKEGKDKINLENHLKGLGDKANEDHFFNINKYPAGTFEITGIIKQNNKTMVEGNLTLKGITKNIAFPAFISVNDTLAVINSETFKINRVLWNINYNSKSALENLGDHYIHDDIELKVSVTAKRNNK